MNPLNEEIERIKTIMGINKSDRSDSIIMEDFKTKLNTILKRFHSRKSTPRLDGGGATQKSQQSGSSQISNQGGGKKQDPKGFDDEYIEQESTYEAEKVLEEFAKEMKSVNLGNYKGQIQTIIEPLGSVYMGLNDLNVIDCKTGKKPGTSAREKLKSIVGQFSDLINRIHTDMKNELVTNKILSREESNKLTIDDAIEMLYTRYSQQKSLLKDLAKIMLKNFGGGFVSQQMLTIISDEIRKKYGEKTGGLANSIFTDFVGGLTTIMSDDSITWDCDSADNYENLRDEDDIKSMKKTGNI